MATIKNGEIFYKDCFAYDLSNKLKSKGEVFDADAINQSIEAILSTSFGERLFNPYFGSELPSILFETLTKERVASLLESILKSVELWENRITIIKSQVKAEINSNDNSMTLTIPYIINKQNITSTFKRKILF